MPLCQPVIWSMAAMLRNSVVDFVVVVRTRLRVIPLAVITMRKSTHGFPFVSHIWDAYGAPLGGPSGRRSPATNFAKQWVLCLSFSCNVIGWVKKALKSDWLFCFTVLFSLAEKKMRFIAKNIAIRE